MNCVPLRLETSYQYVRQKTIRTSKTANDMERASAIGHWKDVLKLLNITRGRLHQSFILNNTKTELWVIRVFPGKDVKFCRLIQIPPTHIHTYTHTHTHTYTHTHTHTHTHICTHTHIHTYTHTHTYICKTRWYIYSRLNTVTFHMTLILV
jgi:hypothetical protein